MRTFIAFCFILLLSTALFAQPVSRARNWDTALLPQGYPAQSSPLSISNLGFNNPSFLSRFKGISAGLSYRYGFEIENAYIGGMMGKSLVNGLPYSAALAYQAGDFHFGAAVTQRYNLRIDTGPVPMTTAENPDGTGETGYLVMDRDIHDYSLLSSFRISNLTENSSLSLGIRLTLGRLYYNDHNINLSAVPEVETSAYAIGFALGADYKFSMSAGDFNFGACFEKGLDFRKDVQFPPVKDSRTGPNGQPYYILQPSYRLEIYTPDALRFDAGFEFSKLSIVANVSEIFWNEISENYKNSLEASAGAVYKTSGMLSLFFGASMNDRNYSDNLQSYFIKDYNALFLTIEADLAYGGYTFGLSVSDSHLFSAETRRQTIGKLTLGYQF